MNAGAKTLGTERAHLLIVEDDPLVAECLARGLDPHLQVSIVSSATEALSHIENGHGVDAVLSDVNMPDLSDIELRRRVLNAQPRLADHFSFMTGGGLDPNSLALLTNESERCIEKPFTIQELRAFLRRRGVNC